MSHLNVDAQYTNDSISCLWGISDHWHVSDYVDCQPMLVDVIRGNIPDEDKDKEKEH